MKRFMIVLMIAVAMLLCSCASLQVAPEPVLKEFTITKTILCTEHPGGYQKYTENVTNQQSQCRQMYIYFEFANLTIETDENGEHIWLGLASRILDVKGNVVYQEPPRDLRFYLKDKADPRWICYRTHPQHPRLNLQPGGYTFQFVIVDLYTEKNASGELQFTIISCSRQA